MHATKQSKQEVLSPVSTYAGFVQVGHSATSIFISCSEAKRMIQEIKQQSQGIYLRIYYQRALTGHLIGWPVPLRAGLNLCRNKPDPDPAPPKSDPAPHFVESPSSHANERCLCWPIFICVHKWKILYNDHACGTSTFEIKNLRCADVKWLWGSEREKTRCSWITQAVFKWLI